MSWTKKDTLLGKLRQARPHHLLVHVADEDEPRRINCINVRNWAQRAMNTLADIPWERVELLDKTNGTLGEHRRGPDDDPPPSELESLVPSRSTTEGHALLGLLIRAQDSALDKQQRFLQPLIDGFIKLAERLDKRQELVERQYEHALRAHAQHIQALRGPLVRARPSNDEEDDEASMSGSMLESMLPAILQAAAAPAAEEPRRRRKPPKRARPRNEEPEARKAS